MEQKDLFKCSIIVAIATLVYKFVMNDGDDYCDNFKWGEKRA